MTRKRADNRCLSLGSEAAEQGAGYVRDQLPANKWQRVLKQLAAAPLRLHRYRRMHAEVIEDALRAYDCRTPCGDGDRT